MPENLENLSAVEPRMALADLHPAGFAPYPEPCAPHRHSPWRFAAPLLLGWLAFTAVRAGSFWDPAYAWVVVALGLVGTPLIASLTVLAVEELTPTSVQPWRLHGYSAIGLRTSVAWKEVRAVRHVRLFPGLEWLALVDDRSPLTRCWLPLFVRDRERLVYEVAQWAGESHVLTRTLRRHYGLPA